MTARNEFENLLRALHVLETTGDDNGSEGDSLRDAMEPLWDAMTGEEQVEMRRLSASLREEPKTNAGRAVSEILKTPVSLASSPRGLGNKKPTAYEIANTCNACGQQMERGAVMVCHECAGKRVLHPTPLKIGETIRWKKDGDSPVLEKSDLLKKVFFIRAGDPKAKVLTEQAMREIIKWLDSGYGFDIVLERRDDGPDAV